jgi:hypothetical protein
VVVFVDYSERERHTSLAIKLYSMPRQMLAARPGVDLQSKHAKVLPSRLCTLQPDSAQRSLMGPAQRRTRFHMSTERFGYSISRALPSFWWRDLTSLVNSIRRGCSCSFWHPVRHLRSWKALSMQWNKLHIFFSSTLKSLINHNFFTSTRLDLPPLPRATCL